MFVHIVSCWHRSTITVHITHQHDPFILIFTFLLDADLLKMGGVCAGVCWGMYAGAGGDRVREPIEIRVKLTSLFKDVPA